MCSELVSALRVPLPDVVSMQTRQPNLEGAGEIPLRRLVKEALRMRPSRIVVGEVRQEECLDLLIALNSGLHRLIRQEPVRTKQQAGLVMKQVRELLPALEGHAAAWEVLDEKAGVVFADDVSDVQDFLDDLRDAEDADEREDAHIGLQSELQDLLAGLAT